MDTFLLDTSRLPSAESLLRSESAGLSPLPPGPDTAGLLDTTALDTVMSDTSHLQEVESLFAPESVPSTPLPGTQ